MKKAIKFAVAGAGLILLSACGIQVKTNTAAGVADRGGVYLSSNKGDLFTAADAVPTVSGNPDSIDNVNVNKLVVDPSDSQTLYLLTETSGLYYTNDISKGWQKISVLPDKGINDLAVDPNEHCTLYLALNNQILKSSDCGRSFTQIYSNNNAESQITTLAVETADSHHVYSGDSLGVVRRSLDGGVTWAAIQTLSDGIAKILISPEDNNMVLTATVRASLYRFNADSGASVSDLASYNNKFDDKNWQDINANLGEFAIGNNFRDLIYSPLDNVVLLATDKVLVKSSDNGSSWGKIKLLTADAQTKINALAVNPKNYKEIYYVTDTTFYRTTDGGATWSAKELPTTRTGASLVVSADNGNLVYLGVAKVSKKALPVKYN